MLIINKKMIVLSSIITFLVITVIILSSTLPFIIPQNNLQEREFLIESVVVTDMFSDYKEYTLKIKSKEQFLFKKYPAKIDGSNYTISFDNLTHYKFYGKEIGDMFVVKLVTKMKGERHQIIKQTFHLKLDNLRTVLKFGFFKVGGIIEVTFLSLPLIN